MVRTSFPLLSTFYSTCFSPNPFLLTNPHFRECFLTLAEVQSNAIDMSEIEPNLDESFVEDDDLVFDRNESSLDSYFYRKKRLSCFVHNLMLAVKKVGWLAVGHVRTCVLMHAVVAFILGR